MKIIYVLLWFSTDAVIAPYNPVVVTDEGALVALQYHQTTNCEAALARAIKASNGRVKGVCL